MGKLQWIIDVLSCYPNFLVLKSKPCCWSEIRVRRNHKWRGPSVMHTYLYMYLACLMLCQKCIWCYINTNKKFSKFKWIIKSKFLWCRFFLKTNKVLALNLPYFQSNFAEPKNSVHSIWIKIGEIDPSIKFLNPEKLTLKKDETFPTSPIPTKVIMSWIEEAIY